VDGSLSADQESHLIDKLADKLTAAHAVWRTRTPPIDRELVAASVERWVAAR
jgi:hypothetical protein